MVAARFSLAASQAHTVFPGKGRIRVEIFHGKIGFVIKNIETGQQCEYHADDLFPAASIFKVPIIIEMMRQARKPKVISTDSGVDTDKIDYVTETYGFGDE